MVSLHSEIFIYRLFRDKIQIFQSSVNLAGPHLHIWHEKLKYVRLKILAIVTESIF